MPKPCALLIDDDRALAEALSGCLGSRLAVEVRPEWRQELRDELDPAIIFVAVDLPDKSGFASCRRVRAGAPDVPIVLTTATIPAEELELNRQAESAQASLDKRSLDGEEVLAKVEALLAEGPEPSPPRVASHAWAERDESEGRARVPELEAEVEALRQELDITRRAARDGDFLRLSSVVTTKEKEISRLRKEVTARERDLVTARRALREALSQAAAAKREREQATGHVSQLDNDLQGERDETLRLRAEAKQLAAGAAGHLGELEAERRRHAEARRLHQATLAAHAETLQEVKQEQQALRITLERKLQVGRTEAVTRRSKKWRARFERVLAVHEQSSASLEAQRAELVERHEHELDQRDRDHKAALEHAVEEMAADARQHREELQRLHEASLAEALAAHATAEERNEQERSAAEASEAQARDEHSRVLAESQAHQGSLLEGLQREHAESVQALRRHFEEQLAGFRETRERERETDRAVLESDISRLRGDLAAARSDAARQERLSCEAHEREFADGELRQAEAVAALEARHRDERAQALEAATEHFQKRLEASGREYADSLETLRQEQSERLQTLSSSVERELARREEEHRAARRHDAEELSAAHTRAARLEQQSRQKHEAALLRLEAGHAEALAGLDARLRKEGDEAVASTVATWEEKLARVRSEGDQERERLRQEHQRALEALRAEQATSAQQAAEAHRAKGRAVEGQLREEQANAVAATSAEWQDTLEALRQEHAAALDALRREHQETREAREAAAAQRSAEKDAEVQVAERHGTAALASARAEAARRDQQTREEHERELLQAETKQSETLADLERRLTREHQERAAATTETWERELEELRAAHAASLEELRHQHEDQVGSLQAGFEQEQAERDAAHAAELERLSEELAAVHAELEELQTRALSPKQHQEALEELESRLGAEREAAVSAVTGDWKEKMDRLRRGHTDTLVALRREHQDQIDAMRAAHENGK